MGPCRRGARRARAHHGETGPRTQETTWLGWVGSSLSSSPMLLGGGLVLAAVGARGERELFGLAAAAGGSTILPMHQGLGANAAAYGAPLMRRLEQLAAFTEIPGQLTRRYLSPAHLAASRQVAAWMREAGMEVRK